MLPVIALYVLAGAIFSGGVGGGLHVANLAKERAASELQRRQRKDLEEALREEISLAELKDAATKLGIDVQALIDGKNALKRGSVSLDALLKTIEK